MKQRMLTLCAAVAAAAVAAVADPREDDGRTSVEVVGLQVVKPLPGDRQEQSLTGRKTGTVLTLRAARPDTHFLGVDGKLSKLDAFADDRNTELVSSSAALLRTWLDGETWVSRDGTQCLFEVVSLRPPARGAKEVRFQAKIILKCGRDGVTAEQPDFRLEKDAELKVGPAPMKVTGVQRGDQTTIFTLSTKGDVERIASIRFYGADGKEIDTQLLEKAVVGFMGNTFHDRTYCLKTEQPMRIEAVTARVHYFHKVERIAVPVHVTVGVGL